MSMRRSLTVLTLLGGLVHGYYDGYRTETQTAIETTWFFDTETPIFWSTDLTTATMTPLPTTSATTSIANTCDALLNACQCDDGYHCEFVTKPVLGEPCPPLRCVPSCLECSDDLPTCNCRSEQVCVYQPGSCYQCPFMHCLDVPASCVECPTCPAKCPCKNKKHCVYHPQTCESCAHYSCKGKDSCPALKDSCRPACKDDETCQVKLDKLTRCPIRACVPKDCQRNEVPLLVDPCSFCSEKETCSIDEEGKRSCIPKAIEPCLLCPPLNNAKQCGPHEHLVIEPNSCHKCGEAQCVPDRCINCFTFPIPIKCKPGQVSVLIPPSCYDCGKYVCVDQVVEPDCSHCPHGCRVSGIVAGVAQTECNPERCVGCPSEASCDVVKCPGGFECQLSAKTCEQCPVASCVRKLPVGCEPSTCAVTLCPVGTRCVEQVKDGCPIAKCVSEDDCIMCPQVMPQCNCEDPSHCRYVPQSCLSCSHYKCVEPIDCAPSSCEEVKCPLGTECQVVTGGEETCPVAQCKAKPCLTCPRMIETCKHKCSRDEVCRVTVGTCEACSSAECVKDPSCKECDPRKKPECNCGPNEKAVFDEGDCDHCPRCKCLPKPCVDCPERDLAADCNACPKDTRCEIIPGDCYNCERAVCLPNCIQCDPRLAECNCSPNETCVVEPGDCDRCPRATCRPQCPKVECKCKAGEEEESILIGSDGCPFCECVTKPCPKPNRLVAIPFGPGKTARLCVGSKDIRKCPTTLPQCNCHSLSDCIFEPRMYGSCAEFKCKRDCVECPETVAPCECSDPSKCILQPRSCDHCAHYYCQDQCTECDEPLEPCPCKDPSDCLLRPRTCFWCAHYQCIPPSKRRYHPL